MSHKITIPEVTYDVTTMGHQVEQWSAADFHNALKNDEFIENIQCFQRCLWKKPTKGAWKYYQEQSPCLIVKSIIPEAQFDQYACYKLYEFIQQNPEIYYPNCFMISYSKEAEPIKRDCLLFDRNMNLLLPQQEKNSATNHRFLNATDLRMGLHRWSVPHN